MGKGRIEKEKQDLKAAALFLLPFRKFTCQTFLGPKGADSGFLSFVCPNSTGLHDTSLTPASVEGDHFQDDTKALAQGNLLLPIFSFKHFDQYPTCLLYTSDAADETDGV